MISKSSGLAGATVLLSVDGMLLTIFIDTITLDSHRYSCRRSSCDIANDLNGGKKQSDQFFHSYSPYLTRQNLSHYRGVS